MSPIGHNITAISAATAYMRFNNVTMNEGILSLPRVIMSSDAIGADHTAFVTLVASGMILGARAPDRLEIPSFNQRTKTRRSVIPHRTLTHWPPIWLAMTLMCWFLWRQASDFTFILTSVGLGFCTAGWLHLAMDIMTPCGIPIISPFGSRFSFNLYRTSGPGEWLCILLFVISCYLFQLVPLRYF